MDKELYEDTYEDSDSAPLNHVEDGPVRTNSRRRVRSKAWKLIQQVQPLFAVINVLFSVVIFTVLLSVSRQQLQDKPKFNQNGDIFGLTPKCK